jgi:hypothetical protein
MLRTPVSNHSFCRWSPELHLGLEFFLPFGGFDVAVGTTITDRPPHRSVQAR